MMQIDALSLIRELIEENEKLRAEQAKIKRKVLMEAASKFAGHSDYHGDTVLGKLICMAEGKEVGEARPLDKNKIKSEAIKEVLDKLKDTKIKFGDEYMIYADNIDVIEKEMVGEQR
jgi:hypothetical protein